MKVSCKHLVRITRDEVDYLIKRKLLRSVRGQYPDLSVASRKKKSKNKHYYVNENLVRFLPKVDNI